MKSQQQYPATFSCEFFPPKTEQGKENLRATIQELKKINPTYLSCTYGAGGTTQEGTWETVKEIQGSGIDAAPHITCIGSTKDKISGLLDSYKELGINRIVALRGDLPEGQDKAGEFMFANELVAFIRAETGDHFHIEVAAYPEKHPEAATLEDDINNFKGKVDAGASSAITQYFFNPDSYFQFVDRCEKLGISIPIVPGIMPITNYKQLARFSDSCGAIIPQPIRTQLESYGDDL
ncbi:MAG: methylenetetrahydrofolate reductase, partial [Gammaproteobacteria bacterium]|nr:methylenetetrahydrofolate reductase [Gammaproteobacteria bacterium]